MYENLASLIEQVTKLVDELAATDRSAWNDDEHLLFNIMPTALDRLNKLFKEVPDKHVPPQEMRSWLFDLRSPSATIEYCSKRLLEEYGRNFTDIQKQYLSDLLVASQQFFEVMLQMAHKLAEDISKADSSK